MKNLRSLAVWEKAHALTLQVYGVTNDFPRDEKYGLVSQLRRSGASVPTNIAEGCGRNGDAELARFLDIAMGSASEAEYQILLSHELGYIKTDLYEKLKSAVEEIKRMLAGLIQRLRG